MVADRHNRRRCPGRSSGSHSPKGHTNRPANHLPLWWWGYRQAGSAGGGIAYNLERLHVAGRRVVCVHIVSGKDRVAGHRMLQVERRYTACGDRCTDIVNSKRIEGKVYRRAWLVLPGRVFTISGLTG